MNTSKLLSTTSLAAGLLIFTAPALAAHHEGSPASPAQSAYGHDCRGMPGYRPYAYQRPAMPPYGYPRPLRNLRPAQRRWQATQPQMTQP